MTRALRAGPLLAVGLALAIPPPPALAQLGRLRNMVAGVEKGKVYGFDVTRGSSIVFVVDLTPVVDLPPDAVENLRRMAAEQGETYVRQKLAEEGTDWALRAAGPAGMVVREALARRSDRAERARNHVRAAIEGLDGDQWFGLVSFEAGAHSWQPTPAVADKANRDAARAFVAGLQKVEGDGFLRSALLAAAGLAPEEPGYGALGGATGPGLGGAVPLGAATTDPQVQAAMVAAAALSASPAGATLPAAPGPVPPGSTISAESLERGIELALELEPETIVVVVAAAPSVDAEAFVARIGELVGGREVAIQVAVFGEKQPGGSLAALAEANGGRLLTESEREE